MKLKLTLQRPSGPAADIVVTTDAAASVGEVAAAIAAVDPFRAKTGAVEVGPSTLRIVDPAGGAAKLLEPDVALAVETDEAVFSGAPVDEARSEALWTEALAAVDVAKSAVSGGRRLLSRFRVRTARDLVSRLANSASKPGKGQ